MMLRLLIVLMALAMACSDASKTHEHAHGEDEGWGVTAWGEAYEIFAECDPLVAGQTATSHTHVTVLADFSPLRKGRVTAILRANGGETVFVQETALRDGIFSVAITPPAAGSYAFSFRVESQAGNEEIAAGVVRVGTAGSPGGLTAGPPRAGDPVPADHHAHGAGDDHAHADEHAHAAPGAESTSFLKEQQWRTPFRTGWAARGEVFASVRAPATIRAAAGSEVLLTAPLDGVVGAGTRVFAGREVAKGDVLMSLAPRAVASSTLPELEAETAIARTRLARLEELLRMGAVSQAEVENARARLTGLETRLGAANGLTAGQLDVRAPFAGRIAEAHVVPGSAVNAGDPLVRLVRTPPVWIEVAVSPRDVARLRGAPAGVSLETAGVAPVLIGRDATRLVSIAPEIDRAKGTVTVILETAEPVPFPLGASVTAEVLLAEPFAGVVVPAGAIVDDGGVPVVYVQTAGESFERRPVVVATRQGDTVLVDGIREGERIVVAGGAAIRRAALLSSGEVEGHVH